LGPSEKHFFCWKVQRMRDICDPYVKNPILGHTHRLTKVLRVLRCAKNAPKRPKKIPNPSGLSRKKCLLCRKSAILSITYKCQFWEGWGGSLKNVLILVQRPQHKSTSILVRHQENNQIGASFIEFGDTKKCFTLSGLELVPKSSKKLIGGSQLHAQRSKMHLKTFGPWEKIPFVKKKKN